MDGDPSLSGAEALSEFETAYIRNERWRQHPANKKFQPIPTRRRAVTAQEELPAESQERDNAILNGVQPDMSVGPRQAVMNTVNAANNFGGASSTLTEAGLNGSISLDSVDLADSNNTTKGSFTLMSGTLLSGFGSTSDDEDNEMDEDNDEDGRNWPSSGAGSGIQSHVDSLEEMRHNGELFEVSRKQGDWDEYDTVIPKQARRRVLEGARRIGKRVFKRSRSGDMKSPEVGTKIRVDTEISVDTGPPWMNRLPRITSVSRSQAKSFYSVNEAKEELPPGSVAPLGTPPSALLRRMREDWAPSEDEMMARSRGRRKEKWSTTDEQDEVEIETPIERRRREMALRGVGETDYDQPGRARSRRRHEQDGRSGIRWKQPLVDPKRQATQDSSDIEGDDDKAIRFTVGGAGRRLTKQEFIREVQSLDTKVHPEVDVSSPLEVENSENIVNDKLQTTPGSRAERAEHVESDFGRLSAKKMKQLSLQVDQTRTFPKASLKPIVQVNKATNEDVSEHGSTEEDLLLPRSSNRNDPGSWHEWEHLLETRGDDIIVKNENGKVIEARSGRHIKELNRAAESGEKSPGTVSRYQSLRKRLGVWRRKDDPEEGSSKQAKAKGTRAHAYQFGNNIIVEDEDGEVVKTYEIPPKSETSATDRLKNVFGAISARKASDQTMVAKLKAGNLAATQFMIPHPVQLADDSEQTENPWTALGGTSAVKAQDSVGPISCPFCEYVTEDGQDHDLENQIMLHVETTHPEGGDSPFIVQDGTNRQPYNEDIQWASCPVDYCGEDILLTDLQSHIDYMHTANAEGSKSSNSMEIENGLKLKSGPMPDGTISMPIVPDRTPTLALVEDHEDLIASSTWSDASSMVTFDNASIFSNESASTGQSSVYDPLGAAEDFIAILLSDFQLDPLFIVARSAIDSQTFKIELHQLLRRYSKDLYQEAQSPLDKVAINFVRRYRRRIAYAVSDDVYQLNAKKTPGKSNKAEAIERYLQQLPEIRSGQDSDSSEDENDQEEPLSNLQRVRDFLVNSRAYENFRAAVIQFILDRRKPPSPTLRSCNVLPASIDLPSSRNVEALADAKTDPMEPSEVEASTVLSEDICTLDFSLPGSELSADPGMKVPGAFPQDHTESIGADWNLTSELGIFKKLHYLIARSFRPTPKQEFKRIEWLCDCGTPVYGDFSSDNAEELEVLKSSLTGNYSQNATGPSDSGTANGPELELIRSATASISSSNTGGDISLQSTRSGRSSSATSVESQEGTILNTLPNGQESKKYIALCVNKGEHYIGLGEIEASKISSDKEVFQQIKKKYLELRSFRSRALKLFLIKPVDIKFVKIAIEDSHRVDILSDTYPHNFPSKADVDNKRYSYSPCPLALYPAIPSTAFLHYMSCTAALSKSKKWFNRLPKKLDKGLEEVRRSTCSEIDVTGWGIHIIEGPNAAAITLLTGIFMTICGIGSIVYSVMCDDVSGGFAIGAFVVALWAAWVTALFFHWKKQ